MASCCRGKLASTITHTTERARILTSRCSGEFASTNTLTTERSQKIQNLDLFFCLSVYFFNFFMGHTPWGLVICAHVCSRNWPRSIARKSGFDLHVCNENLFITGPHLHIHTTTAIALAKLEQTKLITPHCTTCACITHTDSRCSAGVGSHESHLHTANT